VDLKWVVFLFLGALMIGKSFIINKEKAKAQKARKQPVSNPPSPESPLVNGLFLSSSYLIYIIHIGCPPLSALTSAENLIPIVVPALAGGVLTAVLSAEQSRFIKAMRAKEYQQAQTLQHAKEAHEDITKTIADLLEKDARITQKRVLEICSQHPAVIQFVCDHLPARSVEEIIRETAIHAQLATEDSTFLAANALHNVFARNTPPQPPANRVVRAEQLRREADPERKFRFDEFLEKEIIMHMAGFVRNRQAQASSGVLTLLDTHQPGMWKILRKETVDPLSAANTGG
jgi:hypothetical protein